MVGLTACSCPRSYHSDPISTSSDLHSIPLRCIWSPPERNSGSEKECLLQVTQVGRDGIGVEVGLLVCPHFTCRWRGPGARGALNSDWG